MSGLPVLALIGQLQLTCYLNPELNISFHLWLLFENSFFFLFENHAYNKSGAAGLHKLVDLDLLQSVVRNRIIPTIASGENRECRLPGLEDIAENCDWILASGDI